MGKFLLYKYVDGAGTIMYIGQTIQELSRRHYQHCQDDPIYESLDLYYTEAESATQLNLLEAMYISKYKPTLNKVLKNSLPATFDFVDNLVFKKYSTYNIYSPTKTARDRDFSKLMSFETVKTVVSSDKRKVLKLLDYKIILLYYIKGMMAEQPIECVALNANAYWQFHNCVHGGKNTLSTEKFDFLFKRDDMFYLKIPCSLKEELSELSLEELLFLDGFNSKYSFIVYFYLRKNGMNIRVPDFMAEYDTGYNTYATLYKRVFEPAFTDLNLKVSKKIKSGKRITELILESC